MQALSEIRVLDLSQYLAAPGASMYLGDYGAQVVKIEPPQGGDAIRDSSADPFFRGNSLEFVAQNRNKRSLTLDLRQAEGRAVLHKLVPSFDVVVHNLRDAPARRLGIDYETLGKLHPGLIYAGVSAFGERGPYADKGGFDRILQGMAGLMGRRLPDGEPVTTGVYASDAATPMLLAFGIMVALWARQKNGQGQKVDVSLLHTWLALQSGQLARAENGPPVPSDSSARTPGVFKCGDGAYINIAANNNRQLAKLAALLGVGDWMDRPDIGDPVVGADVRKRVYALLREQLLTAPSREWIARIQSVDVPVGPILERAQVFEETQVLDNAMLKTVQHPVLGPVTITNTPVRLSATPPEIRRLGPLLGEHSEEVLSEFGYAGEEIAGLRARGVI